MQSVKNRWEIYCTLDGRDGSTARELRRLSENADPETTEAFGRLSESEWEEPVALPGNAGSAPFPVETLGSISGFVEAVAEETGTPIDLAAVAVLGIASSVLAGAVVVEGPEGFRQPVNLYLACLAAPGEGKTPVMSRCGSVLDAIEADRYDRMASDIREAESLRKVAEARLREAVIRAAKADRTDALEAEEEVREATRELALRVVPAFPRLYTRDVTPEGVVKMLGEQDGRLAIVTDEGVEFFELASRYSGNGKGNLGIYLQGFDGQRYASDRAGRDAIIIERATLTVCLFAQPVVLESLAQDRQASGRGLLARFLWSRPGSLVGLRQIGRRSVPVELVEGYECRMMVLASAAEGTTDGPSTLPLDTQARQLFSSWWAQHEPRLRPEVGDLSGIVEWASKLPGQALRIAGLLHALSTGSVQGLIGAETMSGAIALLEYFTSHALGVFGAMRADPAACDAQSVLDWLIGRPTTEFSVREVYTSKDWAPDRTRAAVSMLGDYGWIRQVERKPGPGRPSEQWSTHPKLRSRTERNHSAPSNMRRSAPGIGSQRAEDQP